MCHFEYLCQTISDSYFGQSYPTLMAISKDEEGALENHVLG